MTAEEVGDTLFNTSKTMRYLNGRSLAGAARGTRGGQRRGFALVASLTLMMLLGLIAVGILAVASTQNRIAAQTILLAEARQQALIGLDAAISDLQMEMGPDQRVSASSGITSDNPATPQHILGVWNSWKAPLYATSDSKRIAETYGSGRSSMFRRWLISCSNLDTQRDFSSLSDLGRPKPGKRICMVGEGTLGTKISQEQYVYADLITMPSAGRNETCFAWWVGGENQKANVAVQQREQTEDPVEILHRTWDTPSPSFSTSENLSFLPDEIEEPKKLLTLRTLPLTERGAAQAGQPYFFDVTTLSYSLLTNVRDGGLKLDLNLLLNKQSLEGTGLEARSDQDCPLAEGEGLPTGTERDFPIGSWQTMHAFYNTWPDATGKDEDFNGTRLVGNVTNAYTRMAGDLVNARKEAVTGKSYAVTYFSDRAKENDRRAGYARVPVLLSVIAKMGTVVAEPQSNFSGYCDSLGVAYAPVVLWWNPYNVQMRVGPKKLWMFALPYRTMPLTYRIYASRNLEGGGSSPELFPWRRELMMQPAQYGGAWEAGGNWNSGYNFIVYPEMCLANDWGNYFVHSENDQSSEIVFEPGEILLFSMAEGIDNIGVVVGDTSSSQANKSRLPQAVPFVQGDQIGYLYNYLLSWSQHAIFDPAYGQVYTGKWYIEVAFETQDAYNAVTRTYGNLNGTEVSGYLGKLSGKKYLHDTGGTDWGPDSREAFVFPHGYDGVDTQKAESITENSVKLPKDDQGNTTRAYPDAYPTAMVDCYPGTEGISPYNFSMGWYDYEGDSVSSLTFMGGAGNEQVTYYNNDRISDKKTPPNYFAAVGIAPKSYNNELLNAVQLFRGKDYRTRSWLHSNPALGGGALYRPDDQMRQYHPFQMAAYKLTDSTAMDMLNSKNGIYGIKSYATGGGEAVSFMSVLELPVHPPFSLAGFAGMRLKPGWYGGDDFGGNNALSQMRRMQYQAGVPGVGIGNSFADPVLPADDVYVFRQTNIDSSISRNSRLFSDFYDHGFIINDALWDRWFCSSVSDMPAARGRVNAEETFSSFVSGADQLPVSRYKLMRSSSAQEQLVARIMGSDGWKEIARYLMVEGGFNVNSVSEDAWAAMLQGLCKRELVCNTRSNLHTVDHSPKENVLFSRFMVSTADRTMDGRSGYNMLVGAPFLRPNLQMATAWGDVRSLSPDSIRSLAREIVKQVRARGPFLNMADFINRRLDGGSDSSLTGALQAAIDATDINAQFNRADFRVKPLSGDFYKFPRAEEGSMYTGAPGYLIQSDVLASLGNILTVRDDTFTVRSYGCVRNARHAILAQAWCEAVVQRTIDFVDPADSPDAGSYNPAETQSAGSNASKLSEVNRMMGRRFRVVSFKWLDGWDI